MKQSVPVRLYQEVYDMVMEFKQEFSALGTVEDTVSFLVIRGLRGFRK